MVRLERGCCFSLRTCTLVLGWLTIICSIAAIGSYSGEIGRIKKDDKERPAKLGAIGANIIQYSVSALCAGWLICAVYNRQPRYMIPYMVSNMIQIIVNILLCIVTFVFLPLVYLSSACISLILNIYFYIVVYSYYCDLNDELCQNTCYA